MPLVFVFFVPEILRLSFFTRALRLSISIVALIGFYLPLFRSSRGATLGPARGRRVAPRVWYVLGNPYGIDNMYVAAVTPLVVMAARAGRSPGRSNVRHRRALTPRRNTTMSTSLDLAPPPDRLGQQDAAIVRPAAGDPARLEAYPALALRAEPRRQPHAVARTATWPACGSAARRKAFRTSPSISPACQPGSDRWSEPVRLSDDPTRSEQNPILFPAPDGAALADLDGADLRQPGHRHRPPPDLRR